MPHETALIVTIAAGFALAFLLGEGNHLEPEGQAAARLVQRLHAERAVWQARVGCYVYATLTAAPSGTPPFSYQWFRNDTAERPIAPVVADGAREPHPAVVASEPGPQAAPVAIPIAIAGTALYGAKKLFDWLTD